MLVANEQTMIASIPLWMKQLGYRPVIWLVPIVSAAFYSYEKGQDVNWDQLNYHFYIPYAFLHHRIKLDITPAAIQNYFNPLTYVPFYFLVRHFPPAAVGIALGAVHGLNYCLIIAIARRLTAGLAHRERVWASAAATAIAVASPMALSEIGTSLADILLSPLVLAGILFLLGATEAEGLPRRNRYLAVAGFSLGVAASLKLTFAVYALGLGAACMVGWRNWRARLQALGVTALGGIAGFVLVGGAWYAKIWVRFGNPFFPYYNNIFASPNYANTPLHDLMFMPQSIVDGLKYPFLWTIGQPGIGYHLHYRDIRFVLLIAIAALVGILQISTRRSHVAAGTEGSAKGQGAAHRRFIVFFLLSFFLWLYEFGIQRYAVPLELCVGPVLVILLMHVGRGTTFRILAFAIAALSVLSVQVPDWNHIPWSSTWYGFSNPDASQPRTLYLLGDSPIAYVAPFLPENARVAWPEGVDPIGYQGKFVEWLTDAVIEAPAVYMVTSFPFPVRLRAVLGRYGLILTESCRDLPNRARKLMICDLKKASRSKVEPIGLHLGQPVFFSKGGGGEVGLLDNWSSPEPWGVWGINTDPSLMLRIDPAIGSGPFRIRFRGRAPAADRASPVTIDLFANDNEVGRWQFDDAHSQGDRFICMPGLSVDARRLVYLRFHNAQPRSPAALGINDDPRPLALGLESLELVPQSAEDCH